MDKAEIRQTILRKRSALSLIDHNEKDTRIQKELEFLSIFRKAKNILIYFSFNSEVDTHQLIIKWMKKKNFFLPRLIPGDTFLAAPISSLEELEINSFGIHEPKAGTARDEANQPLDLIIMPGVAFDLTGSRIGMGKGYYDHFLADKKSVPRIGLAYSEQVLAHVPRNTYDVPVDMIITEKGVIRCTS